MEKGKNIKDFSNFKTKVSKKRTPTSTRIDSRWSYRTVEPVKSDFSLEEIIDIILSGDQEQARNLSKYYYRMNGIYRNNVDLLATLSRYETVVTPIFNVNKKNVEEKIINTFYKACNFVEELNIPVNFCRISRELIITGTYNGLLRHEDGKATIQDLPVSFCRSRYKDYNNLNILEFNLLYFRQIKDDEARKDLIDSFPKTVQMAWRKFEKGKLLNPWVEILPEEGGINFTYGDGTPLLIASIPSLYKMDEAVEREGRRDENELYKLLIQKMPIDNKGELVFELEEVADIHESVAGMLHDTDTIDVLTTFGDTSLENIQDSSAASQSADRIEKYKTNAYDSLGRSSLLFNSDGSGSLVYSIQRDEALIFSLMDIYSTWIKFQINKNFAKANLSFDFKILPITIYNQEKIQKQYFQGAQYGYSKMYAGVALGIKQTAQLSLMTFENEILKMHEKMIPLQSSYTTSGSEIVDETKNKTSVENKGNDKNIEDIMNEGGRPELDDKEKSEKTEANREAE